MHLITTWMLLIAGVASREATLKIVNHLLPKDVLNTVEAFKVACVSTLLLVTSVRTIFTPHTPSICAVMDEIELASLRVLVAAAFTWRGSLVTRTTLCAMLATVQESSSAMIFISSTLFFQATSYGDCPMMVVHHVTLLFAAIHITVCPIEQTGGAALFILLSLISIILMLAPFLIARVYYATRHRRDKN